MNKKYIAPFDSDETLYPIGFLNEDGSGVEIKMLRRNQFPRTVVNSHFNKLLNYGHIENFDCFYTGVHCWVSRITHSITRDDKERFRLTRDHMSPIRVAEILGLEDKVHHQNNIIGASSYFNHQAGHMPLVLKLWIKKKLKDAEYSREELTKKNSHLILDNIIELENQFTYKNSYPWQPETYTDKEEQRISQLIFDEMIQVDKEFLLIDKIKDSFQWLKEYDPTWIEKFINKHE